LGFVKLDLSIYKTQNASNNSICVIKNSRIFENKFVVNNNYFGENMNKSILFLLVFSLVSVSLISAQDKDSSKIAELEQRIKFLEEKFSQDELDKIINEAETKANEKRSEKKTKVFKSGQRSLQAINPEISLTGDMFAQSIINDNGFTEKARTGVYFRGIGLHIQGNLDPFSFTKVALGFDSHGVHLGEAYITWTNAFSRIGITAGKFRQQFGVINRWHVHALDQLDFPLAMTTLLGEAGLNQIGISIDWTMPTFLADASNLILQITNGQNEQLFSGELFSFPATLIHFNNYWDLTRNTYLDLGFTGMLGRNNLKGYNDSGDLILEDNRQTILGGADITIFWEPVNKALYRSFLWRSEFYYVDKEINDGAIKAFGGYTYMEYKFHEQWAIGTRLDYTQPFEENNSSKYSYQIVPYITWMQSHWVKLRLQYSYLDGSNMPEALNTIRFQIVWAVGPHKHDRY